MDTKTKKFVKLMRGILWVFPFYLILLLSGAAYPNPPYPANLSTGQNFLGIGILLSSILSLSMLFETRKEDKLQKQIKTIFYVTVWGLINYSLCCLLYYQICGEWSLIYLWF